MKFVSLDELIEKTYKVKNDYLSSKRLIDTMFRPELLILDDLDYFNIDAETSNILFQIIFQRHRSQKANIFTTNRKFSEWVGVFGDKMKATAAFDRIKERIILIPITGPSYRGKDQLKLLKTKTLPQYAV